MEKKLKRTTIILVAVIMLSTIMLTSCAGQPQVTYIEGDEAEQIIALVEPIANNILKGIELNDYDVFVTNFDETMRNAITPDAFAKIAEQYGKLGSVESIELLNIEDQGDFYGLNYGVNYAGSKVTMRVVVKKSATDLVSGLWFK